MTERTNVRREKLLKKAPQARPIDVPRMPCPKLTVKRLLLPTTEVPLLWLRLYTLLMGERATILGVKMSLKLIEKEWTAVQRMCILTEHLATSRPFYRRMPVRSRVSWRVSACLLSSSFEYPAKRKPRSSVNSVSVLR